MRVLVITAVEQEAEAIGSAEDVRVVAAGIGRTNAAAATAEAIIRHGPFDAVISAGIAGALPITGGAMPEIGSVVVASACVYAEEGIVTSGGFGDMAALGFTLGDFEGNTVPVDPWLLERFAEALPIGPIATVATCSGTDEQAVLIATRTGAVAEAMEGAAVVHAARRLRVPAIELRAISNRTGNRADQAWDIDRALVALSEAFRAALAQIR